MSVPDRSYSGFKWTRTKGTRVLLKFGRPGLESDQDIQISCVDKTKQLGPSSITKVFTTNQKTHPSATFTSKSNTRSSAIASPFEKVFSETLLSICRHICPLILQVLWQKYISPTKYTGTHNQIHDFGENIKIFIISTMIILELRNINCKLTVYSNISKKSLIRKLEIIIFS